MCNLLISFANTFSFLGLIFIFLRTACAVLSVGAAAAPGGLRTVPCIAGAGVCMSGLMPAASASAACHLLVRDVNPCNSGYLLHY